MLEQLDPIDYKFDGQDFQQPRWQLNLQVPDIRLWTVFYIDSPVALDRFWFHLGKSPKFLAVDTERDIIFNAATYSAPVARVRVITLCSKDVCFVISAAQSADSKDDQNRYVLHPRLTRLFEGESTIKIGFGLEEDWRYIVGSFCAQELRLPPGEHERYRTIEPKGFVDLRSISLALGDKRGLQEKTLSRFGLEMDKSLQKSKDWKKVPLPEEFIEYAAIDGIATYLQAEILAL
jgi:3'-5' exonuclease